MSVVVELSHRYLSLEHLVYAMAKAVVKPELGANSTTEDDAAMGRAMLAFESELRLLASNNAIAGHAWDDNLKAAPWADLDIERDVFWIEDLNSCTALSDAGITFALVKNDEADEEFEQVFGELVYNGGEIDWDYWVMQMPVLSAGDASRLLCGLDPDVFQTLEETPNRNDASKAIAKVRKIERLALAQGKESDTQENWLLWAKARAIVVARGFEQGVNAKRKRDTPPASLFGRTERTIEVAGYKSTFWASDEEVAATAKEVSERQAKGQFTLAEAAQVLADARGLDGGEMLKRLEAAFFERKLTVREPRSELPKTREDRLHPWMDIVHALDVDELLLSQGTTYSFSQLISPTENTPNVSARREKKATQQADRILGWLETQGHVATKLPMWEPGKPGVKAACKTALCGDSRMFSDKSFEKAWEELSRQKLIGYMA
ncbi:hypothetical protein [Polaromonas sp.]|uniref:hypothetical protein n=1 Tax=Polaromonas sp. TaxID=1869339 RepID=UPI0024888B98|nr:hypothetical protein [Polaromonas sp.]MDI1339360.1 hypothetical protein [Polaromonas sp.]